MKGSSPALLTAGETPPARAPFTCCAGAGWTGVLTGGADAEEGSGAPAELAGEPLFPGVPDEPGFVVVAGVVVVVLDVVVVSFVVVVSLVVVVSFVVVVSVVVVSA